MSMGPQERELIDFLFNICVDNLNYLKEYVNEVWIELSELIAR